jgi:hypothetical protein
VPGMPTDQLCDSCVLEHFFEQLGRSHPHGTRGAVRCAFAMYGTPARHQLRLAFRCPQDIGHSDALRGPGKQEAAVSPPPTVHQPGYSQLHQQLPHVLG